MKFRKFGKAALIAAVSLGLGLGMTACGPSNTIDFLYVTASQQNPGQISVYKVDSESGALIQIQDSPYSSGGRNPVADATSPNGKNLYVVNHDDNTVTTFGIGTDGKLYPQQTCNTPGSYPKQLAVNPAGTFLYVVETYQPNYSTNIPGPGALVVFPINSVGNLASGSSSCTPVANGTLSYFPVGNNPVGVNILATGGYVYVVNENDATIQSFRINSTSGGVTSVGTYPVGVSPNALASDPTGRFMYVTDGAANQTIGFLIQTNGTLLPMEAPFAAGNLPDAIAADPRGQYVLVANYNSNTISAYSIDQANGQLSANASTPAYATDTGPTCVLIEPALGRYIYTANYLSSTVSGLYLNPDSGALSATQNSPYLTAGQPTCSAAITHGNHSIQHVQP